jgi:hypothetical protein
MFTDVNHTVYVRTVSVPFIFESHNLACLGHQFKKASVDASVELTKRNVHRRGTMVFFSCDGCAEMLKKNQVDGHANRCRRCDSVSCVDCSVSFYGGKYSLQIAVIVLLVGFWSHDYKHSDLDRHYNAMGGYLKCFN